MQQSIPFIEQRQDGPVTIVLADGAQLGYVKKSKIPSEQGSYTAITVRGRCERFRSPVDAVQWILSTKETKH